VTIAKDEGMNLDFDLQNPEKDDDFLITPEHRKRLRGLAKQATPGPWLVWDDHDVGTAYPVKKKRRRRGQTPEDVEVDSEWIANTGPGDGEYISAVDQGTVIGLLNHIENLERRLAEKD
jgi:hypothetical protein